MLLLPLLLQLVALPPADAAPASLWDAMQPIYAVTEKFLDFIQPYDKAVLLSYVLTGVFNGSASSVGSNSTQSVDWQGIIRRYWGNMMGYFLLVCIGLFFIILVPLAGFITCCCRCWCHKCGAKGHQMERRGSTSKRGIFGFLLLLLATAMLFGVVLAFISNQLLRQQMDGTQGGVTLLANVSGSLADVGDLLAEIPARARANSASAVSGLISLIPTAANISMWKLRNVLGTGSKGDACLATARTAMLQLGLATDYSDTYVSNHGNYSSSLADLKSMLALLRANLTGIEDNCPLNAFQSDCDFIGVNLPKLTVTQSAANTGLANVTWISAQLRSLNASSYSASLAISQAALDNVSNVALGFISNSTTEVRNNLNSSRQLDGVWSSVQRLFNSLNEFIANASFNGNSSVQDPLTGSVRPLSDVTAGLELVRYIVFLVIASVGGLVILLWLLGVLCGLAGEPPYEDANCCNRGAGAGLLTAGAVVSYAFYSLLLIAVMALFLAGGIADTEVCRDLTGRAGATGYKQLDSSLQQVLQATSPGLSRYSLNLVSGLLGGCSTPNVSITAALNIQTLVQASEVSSMVGLFINQTSAVLKARRVDLVSGVVLNRDLNPVEAVAMATSAQALAPFILELQMPTIQNSEAVFAAVQRIAVKASKADDKDRFTALSDYIGRTTSTADLLVLGQLGRVTGLADALLQLNASAVGITAQLVAADDSLKTPLHVEQAIKEAIANLSAQLQSSLLDTVARIIGAAADCVALNAKLTSLVRAPCVNLLRPFNGFWTGMGICLICLLPCLILSMKLSNLYRKTIKYQPEYQDETLTLMRNYNHKLTDQETNTTFA